MNNKNGSNKNGILQQGLELIQQRKQTINNLMSSAIIENSATDLDNETYNDINTPIKKGKHIFEGFGLPSTSLVNIKNSQETLVRQATETDLQTKISTYANAYKVLSDRTTNYLTDIKNINSERSYNIFINRTMDLDDENRESLGCYKKSQVTSNLFSVNTDFDTMYTRDLSLNAAIDACQVLAMDTGKTVFGVTKDNASGKYKCYTGSVSENKMTENNLYTITKVAATIVDNNGTAYMYGGLFKDGTVGIATKVSGANNDRIITQLSSTPPTGYSNCGLWIGGDIDQDQRLETTSTDNLLATYACTNATTGIPVNNWKQRVQDFITNQIADGSVVNKNNLTYMIGGISGETVPACANGQDRFFNFAYRCGIGEKKSIAVPSPATGKNVTMNCTNESNKCNDLKLTLDDDGSLILSTMNAGTEIWRQDISGAIYSNQSTKYKAVKGKFGRNYLKPGEFLMNTTAANDAADTPTEFLGSPSGSCRLVMRNNKLQILYEIDGCQKDSDMNSDSISLFSIPQTYPANVGSMGYVDTQNKLHAYPVTMTAFDNNYTFVGKYGVYGGDVGSISLVSDISACKQKCTAFNEGADKCAGFVYDKVTTNCQLKKDTVYQGKRIINPSYDYYTRNKEAITFDNSSCPTTIASPYYQSSDVWGAKISNMGPVMSPSTKCGLANYTSAARTELATARNIMLTSVNALKEKLAAVTNDDKKIKNELTNNLKKLRGKKTEFDELKRDKRDYTGDQLNQLKAAEEDSNLNMISQNYKHMLWSIIAILIILGILRATK